jgi:hypothetical protein
MTPAETRAVIAWLARGNRPTKLPAGAAFGAGDLEGWARRRRRGRSGVKREQKREQRWENAWRNR